MYLFQVVEKLNQILPKDIVYIVQDYFDDSHQQKMKQVITEFEKNIRWAGPEIERGQKCGNKDCPYYCDKIWRKNIDGITIYVNGTLKIMRYKCSACF